MEQIKRIFILEREIAEREKELKELKEKFESELNCNDYQDMFYNLKYIKATEMVKLDVEEFEKKENVLYHKLLAKYQKIFKKKGYYRWVNNLKTITDEELDKLLK